MLAPQRRHQLLDVISHRGFVSLNDLVRQLGVSESTVRRDLDFLEQTGAVKRTHGGAIWTREPLSMPAFDDRAATALPEKRVIARAAAELIRDGETVLLDGGTTTFEVARAVVGRRLQVVTNSLPIAQLFAASPTIDLIVIGGYVYPHTGVALGPLSVVQMQGIHVARTIMSVGGITERGLFNSNLLLVETEQQMIRCADELIVVADHSKFGHQALAHLCAMTEVDRLVVDPGISDEHRRLVAEAGVQLIVAAAAPPNGDQVPSPGQSSRSRRSASDQQGRGAPGSGFLKTEA